MRKKTPDELEQAVIYHKQKYYRGEPKISDAEYDALEDELRGLRPDSHALQVVGYEVGEQKVKHARPMLSLDKSRDPDDIVEWMAGEECLVTDKLDGSSASLVYEGGAFKLAKTRGDGIYGENLTAHFKYVVCPKVLYDPAWKGMDVEIRGEVCITRQSFEELSDEMARRKLDRPKSIRNIVAGLLHRKIDHDLCRFLHFMAYEIISDQVALDTEESKMNLLGQEGFRTPRCRKITSGEGLKKIIADYSATINSYQYLTDGLVVSVNNISRQLGRGFTGHHPKGKIAFKLKSDIAVTTINDILVDVGRTGKLTFVGVVDPVVLSSARVQHVTLHNVRYIKDHNINVGARIEITRSGEVIPKHIKTIELAGNYVFPTQCPLCGYSLNYSATKTDLRCFNPQCDSRIYGRVKQWIELTDIDHIGDLTLRKLFDSNLISGVQDLYDLRADQLAKLERLEEKSAQNIVDSISKATNLTLEQSLSGLCIEGLGKGVAKLLVKAYPTVSGLRNASEDDFKTIDGIGEVIAHNVYVGLRDYGWPLFDALKTRGVIINDAKSSTRLSSLGGTTFVITGSLTKPRKEIKSLIEAFGGKVTGSVSKNTSYLVCNQPSSSSKYKKAQQLGVPIITEDQLYNMAKI